MHTRSFLPSKLLAVGLATALLFQASCAAESDSSEAYTTGDAEAVAIAVPVVVVGGLIFLVVAGGFLATNGGNVQEAAAAASELMNLPTAQEVQASIAGSGLFGYLFTRDYITIGQATITSAPQLFEALTSAELSSPDKIALVHQVAQRMVEAIDPNLDYAAMLDSLVALSNTLYQMGFHEIITSQVIGDALSVVAFRTITDRAAYDQLCRDFPNPQHSRGCVGKTIGPDPNHCQCRCALFKQCIIPMSVCSNAPPAGNPCACYY